MITDRHILIVRKHGVFRPEEPADRLGMVNPSVEIRIAPDHRREMHHAIVRCSQKLRPPRGSGGQEARKISSKADPRRLTEF
jgi:hypothetical protein